MTPPTTSTQANPAGGAMPSHPGAGPISTPEPPAHAGRNTDQSARARTSPGLTAAVRVLTIPTPGHPRIGDTLNIFAGRTSPLGASAAIATALIGSVIAVTRLDASPRQIAAVIGGVLVVALVALAAVLVPWRRLPAPIADRQAALADLPAAQVTRGKRLHAELRPFSYASKAVSSALAVGLGLTPAGSTMITWMARPFGGHWVAQALLAALGVTLASLLLGLPFDAGTHAVLVRYGLSNQTWRAWVADRLKAAAVGTVLLAIMLLAFYSAGHYAPRWWWAWTAASLTMISVMLTFVFPQVIAPIFNTFTPLEPGPLRQRLLALAARDGVTVRDVLVADASKRTTTLNAAVAGFGPTRRIILFDTLLQRDPHDQPGSPVTDAEQAISDTLLRGATDEQIASIVAHELAHAKHGDILTKSALGALRLAAMMCGLYLLDGWSALLRSANVDSIAEPRAIGLFLLASAAFGAVTGPANNDGGARPDDRP